MTIFYQYTFEEVKSYYLNGRKNDTPEARRRYYQKWLHNMIPHRCYFPDRQDIQKIIKYFLLEGEENVCKNN